VTRRITPITADIKTSAPAPVTNYDRLLTILERNAANAREPELIQRLRDAIRAMGERRG